MERIRVLLTHGHQIVREGLRAILEVDGDIEVVGEATNGLEALAAAAECHPHVVVMNAHMPVMDGIETTRRLKQEVPDVSVMLLTASVDDSNASQAIQAGATGYLLQDVSKSLLATAVRAVYSGGALFDTSLIQQAIAAPSTGSSGVATGHIEKADDTGQAMKTGQLTPREREVLAMVMEGKTNKEIAASLFMSRDTVKKRIQSILIKLGAIDRTDAAVKAMRAGLVL